MLALQYFSHMFASIILYGRLVNLMHQIMFIHSASENEGMSSRESTWYEKHPHIQALIKEPMSLMRT